MPTDRCAFSEKRSRGAVALPRIVDWKAELYPDITDVFVCFAAQPWTLLFVAYLKVRCEPSRLRVME